MFSVPMWAATVIFGRALALAGGSFAAFVLMFGWIGGLDRFVRFGEGHAAMVPSTALCLMLLGGAFVIHAARGDWVREAQLLVANVVAVIVGLHLCIGASHVWEGSEVGLLHALQATDHMAPGAAIGLLVAVMGLILASDETVMSTDGSIFVASLGLLTSVGALALGAFDPASPYAAPLFQGMSEYTAVTFALCFAGLLLMQVSTYGRPD